MKSPGTAARTRANPIPGSGPTPPGPVPRDDPRYPPGGGRPFVPVFSAHPQPDGSAAAAHSRPFSSLFGARGVRRWLGQPAEERPVFVPRPPATAAAPSPPLIVTADRALADDLLRLAAAAGVQPTIAADAGTARSGWASAPLVLV